MASYRTEALVLKKRRFAEADNVLIVASPTEGRIDAIAKGVRKTTSRFGGRLEPFSHVRLVLHRGRTFDTITSVEVLDGHEPLRGDVDRTAHAAVVADVLDKVLVRGQEEPTLFSLADVTWTAMETDGADPTALVLAFGIKAMAMLGLRPGLDSCLSCGTSVSGDARFSPSEGGVACLACASDVPDAGTIGGDAVAAMRALMRGTMAEVAAMVLEPRLEAELLATVRAFLLAHVHGRLRSLEFLTRLKPVGS